MIFDNKAVAHTINFVQEMISKTGKLSPMVVGKAGEKQYIAPCIWGTDEEKGRMTTTIKALFKSKGVTEIIFMSEAWGAEASKEEVENRTYTRPSLCANRKEMIIITYFSKTENISASMPILRDGGNISLGAPKIIVGDDFEDSLWGDYFKKEVPHESRRFD